MTAAILEFSHGQNCRYQMESVLKRDRLIIFAALAATILPAWGYMVHEARGMNLTGACCCAGMKMSGPDTSAWSTATLLPLFLMWAEMMVAMMLPSAAPMILTFAKVQRNRREQERPFISTGIFVLGYLAIWTAFSAAAAVMQWALHGEALLSPKMVGTSPWLGGALLIAAGIFQWTPLKKYCLTSCCSPLSFLMTSWREGKWGAFTMGLKHGVKCAGCCWILMLLLFVAGVMNMWWIAILTILVLLEKVLPRGLLLGKMAGVFFIGWGVWLIAGY
jgi:predicted metal-binding membrane protein